ncbi:DUF3515 domain-containing protein [uncultured Nocardioides sp.]|uniref:DUF3515 domain-containing protein n=1 Tax=uncultured Nocardioides sp. TaxID=198441 RepID=UPI002635BE2F|nr:DUF3515 domain-containing protein [uncultured Nocardioides sp.]
MSRRPRAAALLAAALLLATATACAPTLEVDTPDVEGADARACADLVDALPDELANARRREVVSTGSEAVAWGDPPILLTCGVGTPLGFSRVASACQDVAGVDWFVPDEQMEDQTAEAVATTIGFSPALELRIPADYRPPVQVLIEIAPAIKATIDNPNPCVVADPRD